MWSPFQPLLRQGIPLSLLARPDTRGKPHTAKEGKYSNVPKSSLTGGIWLGKYLIGQPSYKEQPYHAEPIAKWWGSINNGNGSNILATKGRTAENPDYYSAWYRLTPEISGKYCIGTNPPWILSIPLHVEPCEAVPLTPSVTGWTANYFYERLFQMWADGVWWNPASAVAGCLKVPWWDSCCLRCPSVT